MEFIEKDVYRDALGYNFLWSHKNISIPKAYWKVFMFDTLEKMYDLNLEGTSSVCGR